MYKNNVRILSGVLAVLFLISILQCGMGVTLKPVHSTGKTVHEFEDDPDEFWDLRKEPQPPYGKLPDGINYAHYWYSDKIEGDAYAYVYGGKTAHCSQPVEGSKKNKVFTCYLDNHDYSGVTIMGEKRIDLRPYRQSTRNGAFVEVPCRQAPRPSASQ